MNIKDAGYILIEAKDELTSQLKDYLVIPICEKLQSLYDTVKNKKKDMIFIEFQSKLRDIPKWNQSIIESEYNNIMDRTKCDWLKDLIIAVIVTHSKILTDMKHSKKEEKITIDIPDCMNFAHQCFIQSAKEIYYQPFLFDHSLRMDKKQKNKIRIEKLVKKSIDEVIRKNLQVRKILQEYLGDQYDNNYNDDISSRDDNARSNNLKQIVQQGLSGGASVGDLSQTHTERSEKDEKSEKNDNDNYNEKSKNDYTDKSDHSEKSITLTKEQLAALASQEMRKNNTVDTNDGFSITSASPSKMRNNDMPNILKDEINSNIPRTPTTPGTITIQNTPIPAPIIKEKEKEIEIETKDKSEQTGGRSRDKKRLFFPGEDLSS
jgi:hypothetical protein